MAKYMVFWKLLIGSCGHPDTALLPHLHPKPYPLEDIHFEPLCLSRQCRCSKNPKKQVRHALLPHLHKLVIELGHVAPNLGHVGHLVQQQISSNAGEVLPVVAATGRRGGFSNIAVAVTSTSLEGAAWRLWAGLRRRGEERLE